MALAITLWLTGAGCTKKDSKSSTDTAAQTAMGAAASASGDVSTAAVKPPKLKKRPVDDPAAWKAYRDSMRFVGWTQKADERGCADDPSKHSKDCPLLLTPVQNAHLVDTADVDSVGVIIAKLRNDGRKREGFYGLDTMQTTYIHLYRKSTTANGRTTNRFVTQFVDSATGAAVLRPTPLHKDSPVKSVTGLDPDEFPFKVCHSTARPQRPDTTAAQFQSCRDVVVLHRFDSLSAIPTASQTKAQQGELVTLKSQVTAIRSKHNNPSWISCIQGCCSVEGP